MAVSFCFFCVVGEERLELSHLAVPAPKAGVATVTPLARVYESILPQISRQDVAFTLSFRHYASHSCPWF